MNLTTSPNQSTKQDPAAALWLEAVDDLVAKFTPEDTHQAVQDMEALVERDSTWAEVQGVPSALLWDLAGEGHQKAERGQLEEAKQIFKGLAVMDHRVAYFHTALGSIYQRQQHYFDALAEYTIALDLDEKDITAWTNRGECYYQMGLEKRPLEDLERAIALDPENQNSWGKRARFLKEKILAEQTLLDS